MNRCIAAVAAIALSGACSSETVTEPVAKTTEPVFPPAARPILFSSYRDVSYTQNLQIIAAKVDGSDMLNLSKNPFNDTDPAWSPDGQYIAFASDRSGGFDIYIMRNDGSGIRQLTHDPIEDRSPRWSPDGQKLVFESERDGQILGQEYTHRATDLYVIDVDGSHIANITNTPTVSETWASWSPDGKTIAFTRQGGLPGGIMLVNPDGTNMRMLHSPDPGFSDDVAAWSPDGTMLAYSAGNVNHPPFTATWAIFTVKADGTDARRITALGFSSARFPAWSPDGKRIVYNRDAVDESWGRFNTQNVWVMNADGTGDTKITNDSGKRNELGSPQAWAK